jgi:hypothetical protein
MSELEALFSRPFYGTFSHSESRVTSREASKRTRLSGSQRQSLEKVWPISTPV